MEFEIVEMPDGETRSKSKYAPLVDALIALEAGKRVKCQLSAVERYRLYQAFYYHLRRKKPGYTASMRTRDGYTYITLRKRDEAR